jgi:hypothetical protein
MSFKNQERISPVRSPRGILRSPRELPQAITRVAERQGVISNGINLKLEKSSPVRWVSQTGKGISRKVVEEISWLKNEPAWMRAKRLAAYEIFAKKNMPTWGFKSRKNAFFWKKVEKPK